MDLTDILLSFTFYKIAMVFIIIFTVVVCWSLMFRYNHYNDPKYKDMFKDD